MKSFNTLMLTLALAITGCVESEQPGTQTSSDRVTFAERENYRDFGDYVVHVNVLTTDEIPAEVAANYGITRSPNRAMLNVVVLKKNEMGLTEPVHGTVSAIASNLTGQLKTIEMREIIEQDAIYYIGESTVSHQETLIFDIDVTPVNETRGYALRYTRQFFTR